MLFSGVRAYGPGFGTFRWVQLLLLGVVAFRGSSIKPLEVCGLGFTFLFGICLCLSEGVSQVLCLFEKFQGISPKPLNP